MMIQAWRIMVAGSRNFLRNAWLSTAATAVMAVTLIVVTVSVVSTVALTATIKNVTDKIDVSVYLRADVTQAQINGLENQLRSTGNVESFNYLTQAQAVAAYREQNKNNPSLLQALDEVGNVLPPSLQVKAKNPQKLDEIAAVISKPENQSLLDPTAPPSYSGRRRTTIDRIVRFSNFFKTSGLVASIIFVIIAALIIFNTIRMAIFTRRNEIEIMQLVGATKWFIRGPFIFEAALYGVIAAVLAMIVGYVLVLGAGPKLANYIDLSTAARFFRSYPVLVGLGELAVGIMIGAVSSLLAMGRYLKL